MTEQKSTDNLKRVIVTEGEHKDKKAHVINVYQNTISIEFDDYSGRADEVQRTVVKHDAYERIE